ncbi:MAG: response regulator transcription factor [Planctomycetaceae bacterium]|nr:response regulator transcription factor [Planctomycetaceae bacterium]
MVDSIKKPRILLVEDEQHLAFGIEFNLKRAGYEVVVEMDGQSADRRLTEQAPLFDLVILDLMLPGLNGYDICRRLRKAGGQMPVLILSARSLPEDRTRGFEVGADQYLTKPFDLEELLTRVKHLLIRFKNITGSTTLAVDAEPESVVKIGPFELDFNSYQVTRDGEFVQQLTSLEAKLLKYFIKNAGRVISRGELLENVWELENEVLSRAPDQFIRRLRKLLERDPAQPTIIQTVRDAGYRFVVPE